MRSISATDVPPNFMTRRLMRAYRVIFLGFRLEKAVIHTGEGRAPQPRLRKSAMPQSYPGAAKSTVDEAEVERFSRLAADWWNPRGPMAPLHKFNPVRLAYVRDQAAMQFRCDARRLDCLTGLRILDIGCGAGLVS